MKNWTLLLVALIAGAQPLLAQHKPKALMERISLAPAPKQMENANANFPFPQKISIHGLDRNKPEQKRAMESLEKTLSAFSGVVFNEGGFHPFKINFIRDSKVENEEGYTLKVLASGAVIRAKTAAGEFYGVQTLSQILRGAWFGVERLPFGQSPLETGAAENRFVPTLSIQDFPQYKIRAFMIDPGRAPFTVPLIERTIRMMAHLKLNALHIHLLDDQLCGFKFKTLPLGKENPFALTPKEFSSVITYARSYHIAVIPEIESWGHVQSVIYHFPETYGGPGMWGGASFGIGEKTYQLLEAIYGEIIPLLEPECAFHVGLDEAQFAVLPGEENKGHTPTTHVARIYDLVQRLGKSHGKKITLHLWADHGGRPLPKGLEDKVVIEPWKYRETDEPKIIDVMRQYGGPGKTPLMMGAGVSSIHYHGDYEATRIWCREGLKYPNVLGVTLCLWESNDIGGRLMTLYGGARYAWSPESPVRDTVKDPLGEDMRGLMDREMRRWQALFPDANPEAINADRGPEVESGRYLWPPLAHRPVAPTVE